MKIKYVFCNEVVEIEVSEEWGAIILDMDREERNRKKTETRRHCSLETFNLDTEFPSEENLEDEVIRADENTRLHRAVQQLEPRQQSLIRQVYFEGRKYTDIAADEGICRTSVKQATDRAVKRMKKLMD